VPVPPLVWRMRGSYQKRQTEGRNVERKPGRPNALRSGAHASLRIDHAPCGTQLLTGFAHS